MPVLTVDLDYIAPATLWSRTSAWVETSVPEDGWLSATSVVLGDAAIPIDSAGQGTVTLTSTPAGTKYQVCVEYPLPGSGGTNTWRSGWFSFTADGNLKDLVTIDVPGPVTTALSTHIAAIAGAHVASAITYAGGPFLPSGTVEGAIDALDQRTRIAADTAADLNSLLVGGLYYMASADATAPKNSPTPGAAGMVLVRRNANGNSILQKYVVVTGAGYGQTYVRRSADTGVTWTAWVKLADTAGSNTFTATQVFAANNPTRFVRPTNAADLKQWATFLSAAGDLSFLTETDAGAQIATRMVLLRGGGIELDAAVKYLSGQGQPEGVITASTGSRYVDRDATAGAVEWIKASGTGNTGWKVVYGDTGWRKIPVTGAGLTGYIGVRRTNDTVEFKNTGLGADAATLSAALTQGVAVVNLPTGMRPKGDDYRTWSIGNTTPSRLMTVTEGGDLQLWSVGAETTGVLRFNAATHTTINAWPTVRPGVAY